MSPDQPEGNESNRLRFSRLALLAAVVGAVGGLISAAYYAVLHGLLETIWEGTAAHLVPVWVMTGVGGLLVGLSVRYLGAPGEISAVVDNIHLRCGRLDIRRTPAMLVNSLSSITFGGSAGPEAPLVQIVGSLSSRFGDRLRLDDHTVRTLTICGMAAALGAFFGAPLGGALFALEIPHRNGLEYYEALIPSIVAAFASFGLFRLLIPGGGVLYPLPEVPAFSLVGFGQAIAIGLVGAGLGLFFMAVFKGIGRAAARLSGRPVLLAGVGGVVLGLLAQALPERVPVTTLFWGEYEIRGLLEHGPELATSAGLWGAVLLLGALALLKMAAIGVTLHAGFRGGFIFPLFFIGAAAGLALSLATAGWISLAIAVLCTMAAVNVSVTKTPISTTIILAALSGTSMIPIIGVASLVSFLLTTRVALIETQRPRPIPHVRFASSGMEP